MADASSIDELVARLNHSVELLLRLKLEEVKGDRTQKEMILFLYKMGCSPGDISRLLGVKETNVYPTLSRARQSKNKS
jgi:DNA-directed RNA polymerase specialized sigma24 family protein